MKKFKEFKFDKAKEMLSQHLSIGAQVIKESKNNRYTDSQELESKIILGEDREATIFSLEMKMAQQWDRDAVLRLMCLLSVT